MKREILFKAKRIDNGEWVEGTYTKIAYDCDFADVIIPDVLEKHEMGFDSSTYAIIDTNTLSQFTGLLDKNGDKIFEGDIFHNGDEKILYKVLCPVENLAQQFGYTKKGELYATGCKIGLGHWSDISTIIGNIHDKEKSSE